MKAQLLLIILTLFLCACVAQSPKSGRSVASKSSSKTAATPTSSDAALYWFTSSNVGATLLVEQNLQTEFSLRGTQVHNYLATGTNGTPLYCLVFTFNATGVKKQLRVRAIPSNSLDTTTGVLKKVLRLNPSLSSDNSGACSGTISGVATADAAYSLTETSSTLSSIFYSSSISLYKSSGTTIIDSNIVSTSYINLSSLVFKINPVFTNSTATSCTNASCIAKGYDCCINNVCAKDGAERPDASTQTNYSQAKADVAANPYNFIYWTNVYYVCPNIPHATPTPTVTPNPSAQADSLFQFLLREYYCLNNGTCTGTMTVASVKIDVWNRCGCVASPTAQAPNDAATLCPNYGLKLIKDSLGTIQRVDCDVPTTVEPTPFQNLKFSVSSNAAPHRFFKSTDGVAVDTDAGILALTGASATPEGDVFSYTDEINKLLPNSGSFNMNSIIGQFSVSLSGAIPARMVEVEYDQTYVISATSGYFSSCPKCAKDSWFASFSAYPNSQMGMGVQSAGFTTSRDSLSSNGTLGNYEDSIFGRACWVPPTMIPFSHQRFDNIQTQRLNRLKTQAAYYINGYKRDWYGFNYGALIGSFDGVRWFAIGTGRRITSTSTKLFLAINSPFADLHESGEVIVSIVANNSNNTVSSYDYDPSLALDDARQNQAGTCQSWHQCEKDTDCVTKLGWEYSCVDVSTYKTYWPDFDAYGNEKSEALIGSFNTVLQGMMTSGSAKRCVYRGAGAPCKAKFTTVANEETRKFLTCAPNFYCATVGSDGFNKELVRTPDLIGDILYGQEADVLGRPVNYVTSRDRLSSEIISNIKKNASLVGLDSTETDSAVAQADFGLCRPGKKPTGLALASNFTTYHNKLEQHKNRDTAYRTDYISQIGSCDSSLTGYNRVISCPLFGADGNYAPVKSTGYYDYGTDHVTGFTTATDTVVALTMQNTCGYEQRKISGTTTLSPFSFIELKPLSALGTLANPGVVKDACLRRPGSVCHTDLDCSPNKLHASQADAYDISYFGNTDAERKYWQESLVCGQKDPQPNPTDANYASYDVTQNRCCREVGKDFTMYTESSTPALAPSLTTKDNTNLKTRNISSSNPSADGRYSRYSVVDIKAGSNGAAASPYAEYPHVVASTTPKEFQWKTFADTGKKTCCGGGWVRKFADGSHDWTVTNRLSLNFENFSCLNYNTEAYDVKKPSEHFTNAENISRYYGSLCLAPDIGACVQTPIPEVNAFELVYPRNNDEGLASTTTGSFTAALDTSVNPQKGVTSANFNKFVPYLPTGFYTAPVTNLGSVPPACGLACGQGGYGSALKSETGAPFNYFKDPLKYYAAIFYLPGYMNAANIKQVSIQYYNESHDSSPKTVVARHVADAVYCDTTKTATLTTNPFHTATNYQITPGNFHDIFPHNAFCIGTDSTSGLTFLAIRGCPDYNSGSCVDKFGASAFWGGWTNSDLTKVGQYHAGIKIDFEPMNTSEYAFKTGPDYTRAGLNAGNALYYLTKLGRLELSGVPQIFYEPLYCNSDRSKIVDGIFKTTSPTRANFKSISFPYSSTVNGRTPGQIYDSTLASTATDASTYTARKGASATPDVRITFMDKLATGQIFSDVEFACCLPLGSVTTSGTKCCSNYAVSTSSNNEMTCALPPRTDLSVYFNRFISGEGSGTVGGLVDDDFIPETGEPKLRQSTLDKINALGVAYCSSGKVRNGASFGKFFGEPNQGYYNPGTEALQRYFGILDSTSDYNADDDSGYAAFGEGYHWNHHLYCE